MLSQGRIKEKTTLEILQKEKEHHGPVWKVDMQHKYRHTHICSSPELEHGREARLQQPVVTQLAGARGMSPDWSPRGNQLLTVTCGPSRSKRGTFTSSNPPPNGARSKAETGGQHPGLGRQLQKPHALPLAETGCRLLSSTSGSVGRGKHSARGSCLSMFPEIPAEGKIHRPH